MVLFLPAASSVRSTPLYVAKELTATRDDYEETASTSSAPPPKQAATAPKAVASKKMPKSSPKPSAAPIAELEDVVMDDDEATRKGEPLDAVKGDDDEGDTTDAGEEEGYPLGSHPCAQCQTVVANGMLFCLRCRAPQTDESAKVTKRFFDNIKLRRRILATAATGANPPHGRGFKEARPDERRGSQRAAKLSYPSVAERFDKDDQFKTGMMQEGRNMEDMQKFDYLSFAILPDPGRSEEQLHLRAGSHYTSDYGQATGVAPAELVFYAHCEVEPLRTLRLMDDVSVVPIELCYIGAFLNPRLYCEIAAVNSSARKILTFDGDVTINSNNADDIAAYRRRARSDPDRQHGKR